MKTALALFFIVLLTGCDVNDHLLANLSSNSVSDSAPIRLAIAQAPRNLDPRFASDAASERANRLLYQPLVDFDATSRPTPVLASWEWQSELSVLFRLNTSRPAFHDGTVLTAEDVKATYDSFKTLKGSPKTAEFANIAHIEVLNADALIFHLKTVDPAFVEKLIIGILPKGLIEAGHDFAHNPIGNGPLQFVDWQADLTLKRVQDDQRVSIIEVKDPTVRVLKLLRGEVDVLQGDLPPELVKFLQSQSHLHVMTGPGANFSYLGFNYQDPILKHQTVRQALAHAVDIPAIINSMMVDGTTQAGAILAPSHYAGNATLKPYDYRPDYAKQLLTQAGFKLPLTLTYKTSTDAQRVRLATVIQAQMRKAGIVLSIKSLDWGTFFESVKQGQFQLYGLTWVGIKTPDIYTKVFHSSMVPPNGLNRGRFANAKLDTLLEQQDWQAATQAIHQALPYLPLWYEGQFVAAQQNLQVSPPAADGNWDMLATIVRRAPE